MNYLKTAGLVVALFTLSFGCANAGQQMKANKTMKVLTIGNSFSQNACQYLAEIAKTSGHTIILGHADIGGCALDSHVKLAKIAESDPTNPEGKPYGVGMPAMSGKDLGHKSLKEMLQLEMWDFITIQQASWISNDYSTYQPYGRELLAYIQKYAPKAEVIVHETWEYRCDDPRLTSGTETQEKMHSEVSKAYHQLASDLGLRMIPVGEAFHMADTNSIWQYKPSNIKPIYPALPDQTNSLHAGYYWAKDAKGNNELQMDGHHAGPLGCYLAGCMWYEVFFNENAENISYVPSEIAQSDAKFLRKIASEAIRANKK